MPVRTIALAGSILVLGAVTACSRAAPSAPPGIFFPTVPQQDMYPAAALSAPLIERSGCLFAAGGHDRWLLLWPEGYSATTGQDGRIQVLDGNGTVIGTVGDMLHVGGGETNPVEVGGGAASDDWAIGLTGQNTPTACGHLYWLVAPSQ